jgi:hypothetical protein
MLFLCILSFVNTAFSSKRTIVTVPFNNKVLNPKNVLQANYSFGNFPSMLCFDNNLEKIGEIKWTFKGNIKSSSLPVLLKVRVEFEGEFADKNGSITITNTSNKQIVVSCSF